MDPSLLCGAALVEADMCLPSAGSKNPSFGGRVAQSVKNSFSEFIFLLADQWAWGHLPSVSEKVGA